MHSSAALLSQPTQANSIQATSIQATSRDALDIFKQTHLAALYSAVSYPTPQANSILVAGHDTTSFMLTSTLYYVAKHPEVKAKVFAEIERFGRARKVTHEDMDKFPYLEASIL
eukprot:GHUV01054524.1.p1 GENE.GHUV01054524.1~~GHUV01054524.1.p1  ORF type:complete len:114 (-),score=13.09 GHUV01054524.1:53-394(-)